MIQMYQQCLNYIIYCCSDTAINANLQTIILLIYNAGSIITVTTVGVVLLLRDCGILYQGLHSNTNSNINSSQYCLLRSI